MNDPKTKRRVKGSGDKGTAESQAVKKGGGGTLAISLLALLIGAGGAGGGAFLFQELEKLKKATDDGLTAQSNAFQSEIQTANTSHSSARDSLAQQLTDAQSASVGQLNEAIGAVKGDLGSASDSLTQQVNSVRSDAEAALAKLSESTSTDLAALAKSSQEQLAALSQSSEQKMAKLAQESAEGLSALDSQTKTQIGTLTEQTQSQFNALQESTQQTLSDTQAKVDAAIAAVNENLQNSLGAAQTTVQESVSNAQETMKQSVTEVNAEIERLRKEFNRNQRDWRLAEVDYLLRTATHRIVLSGDLASAISALKAADGQLATLNEIELIPVRQQIAEEIAELRDNEQPDIEGLIFTLSRLARRAEYLPLPEEAAAEVAAAAEKAKQAEQQGDGFSNFTDNLRKTLSNAVVVQPRWSDSTPIITGPSEKQISTAEVLRLHLQAAQLAATRRDQTSYHNHIKKAQLFIEETYDLKHKGVASYLEDLNDIVSAPILPNLSLAGKAHALLKKITVKVGAE